MKKYLFFALALALGVTACNKDITPCTTSTEQTSVSAPASLTVGVCGNATKSTSISAENEVKVENLQVFVFAGDLLDAYGSVDNSSSITLSCTSGERNVYAVVNAPDLSSIATLSALKAATSQLSNNGSTFEMVGNVSVTLPQSSSVTIPVDRIVSRVIVKKITRAFKSSALANLDFSVDAIYITNVAGDINYGLDADPTVWYNKMGYQSEITELSYDAVGQSLSNNSSYEKEHGYYAYPNSTDTDAYAGTWSARHTRLVIEVTLDGTTYYYPITLPALENNKSYEIEEVTLTRPGSDHPDKPVTYEDCTFILDIQDWTVVTVSDGTTI